MKKGDCALIAVLAAAALLPLGLLKEQRVHTYNAVGFRGNAGFPAALPRGEDERGDIFGIHGGGPVAEFLPFRIQGCVQDWGRLIRRLNHECGHGVTIRRKTY